MDVIGTKILEDFRSMLFTVTSTSDITSPCGFLGLTTAENGFVYIIIFLLSKVALFSFTLSSIITLYLYVKTSTRAGEMDSLKLVPGLLKRLQIRA